MWNIGGNFHQYKRALLKLDMTFKRPQTVVLAKLMFINIQSIGILTTWMIKDVTVR